MVKNKKEKYLEVVCFNSPGELRNWENGLNVSC